MSGSDQARSGRRTLTQRAARGAVITTGGQVLRLAIQIGGTAILARLLSPSDYGLVAMAMARPIVSSNISGIQEVFNDCECGILINPTHIEEWCRSIVSLLQNPLRAQRLGKCARTVIEKRYDWAVLTEQYVKALIELTALRDEDEKYD